VVFHLLFWVRFIAGVLVLIGKRTGKNIDYPHARLVGCGMIMMHDSVLVRYIPSIMRAVSSTMNGNVHI
jgi:hypothetical protein